MISWDGYFAVSGAGFAVLVGVGSQLYVNGEMIPFGIVGHQGPIVSRELLHFGAGRSNRPNAIGTIRYVRGAGIDIAAFCLGGDDGEFLLNHRDVRDDRNCAIRGRIFLAAC